MPTEVLHESAKIRLELDTQGDMVTIRPMGVIDEDSQLPLILQTLQQMKPLLKSIRFDLAHVRRMNSCGIREWILLMERIGTLAPVSFENLSEVFIEQANMLPGVFGKNGGRQGAPVVHSLQIPYHCRSCSKDFSYRFQVEELPRRNGRHGAPARSCPDCSGALDFDWIEDEYFTFLTYI